MQLWHNMLRQSMFGLIILMFRVRDIKYKDIQRLRTIYNFNITINNNNNNLNIQLLPIVFNVKWVSFYPIQSQKELVIQEKKKRGKKERKEKVFIGREKEKEIDQETSERLLVRRLAGVAPAIVAANRIFQNWLRPLFH